VRLLGWNQQVGRELVGLVFEQIVFVAIVDKRLLLRVLQHMGSFMEEREPEVVVLLVAVAQRNDPSWLKLVPIERRP